MCALFASQLNSEASAYLFACFVFVSLTVGFVIAGANIGKSDYQPRQCKRDSSTSMNSNAPSARVTRDNTFKLSRENTMDSINLGRSSLSMATQGSSVHLTRRQSTDSDYKARRSRMRSSASSNEIMPPPRLYDSKAQTVHHQNTIIREDSVSPSVPAGNIV